MSTKEMQFEEKTACPICDTVLLWHDAIGRFVCLRCSDVKAEEEFHRRMDEDFMDTVNNAWEQDK